MSSTSFSGSSTLSPVYWAAAGSSGASVETIKDAIVRHKRKGSSVAPVVIVHKPAAPLQQQAPTVTLRAGQCVLDQIGPPDHAGWLRNKGGRYYNTWKETKTKGCIMLQGYKVIADENVNPGKYGFRIIHYTEPSHLFSSEDQVVAREWIKALMKATIGLNLSRPVITSCDIPTISLAAAQAMHPAPRPPSLSALARSKTSHRRDNSDRFPARDPHVLMGHANTKRNVSPSSSNIGPLESFLIFDSVDTDNAGEAHALVPQRPFRDMWNHGNRDDADRGSPIYEMELVDWANSVLPEQYYIHDLRTDLSSGLVLLRLAEVVCGKQNEPPVLDSMFIDQDLEGLFTLFDFLLRHDINFGNVSIIDVKRGRPDKTVQMLKAIKVMAEKRKAAVYSIGKNAGRPKQVVVTKHVSIKR